jgi:hypothetical protein
MIWLTWRQHRAVLAVSTAVVVAFVVWMLIVEHDYSGAARAFAKCSNQIYSQNSPCTIHINAETTAWEQADVIRWILLLLPLLFGVLLGAPLFAGEFERKTVIFAFTQNVSRTRWMVIRWLVIGAAVVILSVALAAVSNWWFLHIPTNGSVFGSRIQPGGFDVTGIVPAAYALFAFALGAALGMILRRTARAIFGTVVLYAAARILFEQYVRRQLAAPVFSLALGDDNTSPNYDDVSANPWNVGTGYRVEPGSGHPTNQAYINHIMNGCGQPFGVNWFGCLTKHGVQIGNLVQPASHFWALQWGEAGSFVAAAALLFGLALWSVRRWRA